MGTWSGNQGTSMAQGVAGVKRVHPSTFGWSPLGQGTKTPTLGYSPPQHSDSLAPHMRDPV